MQGMVKLNTSFLVISVIVALSMPSLPLRLCAREVKDVHGKGEAVIVGITPEQGRLIALQRARADAIEKAAGIHVLGTTLVTEGRLAGQFLKTFTHGFIVDEKVKWDSSFIDNKDGGPGTPKYSATIIATVNIPDKKPSSGFILDASIDRPSYVSGENATITMAVSRKAYVAIFNLRADDRVVMLYPQPYMGDMHVIEPSNTFCFPPKDSGLVLEITTLNGHKRDTEAFMVVAVPATAGDKNLRFLDYFKPDEPYPVPKFFQIYSRFADTATEQILPYEVRKKAEK